MVMSLNSNDTGGMAGEYDASIPWANNYDKRATNTVALARSISGTIGYFAQLLKWGGYNHELANWTANVDPNKGPAPEAPPAPFLDHSDVARALPPAAHANGPGVVTTLVNLAAEIGVKVPDGDTDKLQHAADIWDKYVKDQRIDRAAARIGDIAAMFTDTSSPEIRDIEDHLAAIKGTLGSLTDGARQIAQDCKDHKDALDELRADIKKQMIQFGTLIIFTQVVSKALILFTAGGSEVGGDIATAAEVGAMGRAIRAVVDACKLVTRILPKGAQQVEDLTLAENELKGIQALSEEGLEGAEVAGSGWEKTSGLLRNAKAGKGNFGLGSGTRAESEQAGRAWVGEDAQLASDGKTLVSRDGLRQYRPPSYKPNLGRWQSNFEWRNGPSGQWQGNGHLNVTNGGS
jgi:hypothetical protein